VSSTPEPRPAGVGASGVEVVGRGLVEVEVRDGVGLGGVEAGGLIDELDRELVLGRSARGRNGRRLVRQVEVEEDGRDDGRIGQVGGAQGRVADDATAYQGRSANFLLNVHGRWSDASQDERGIAWCRELFEATAPFATGEAYVNFMTGEEGDRVASAYGSNYDRLVEIKRRYDPTNLFRMNQNIRP
jgi:hypothetical protein